MPAEYRKKMGLKPGDEVIVFLEDGDVHVTTLERVIKRSQEIIRKYVPEGRSLVDELIQDRREEAARE